MGGESDTSKKSDKCCGLGNVCGETSTKNLSIEKLERKWWRMSEEEKLERVDNLCGMARNYCNKLRFQARL